MTYKRDLKNLRMIVLELAADIDLLQKTFMLL